MVSCIISGLTSPAGYLPAAYYAAGPAMTAAGLGAHYASAAVPPVSVSGQTATGQADTRFYIREQTYEQGST